MPFRARVFGLTRPPSRQAGRNFCRTQHPYAAMPPWPDASHHEIDVMAPSQDQQGAEPS